MGSLLQFALLFVCWLAALATLLIFLETWFGVSGRNRFLARRASGAYGVITVFVPMQGAAEKVERTIRSVFEQSYPFIEIVLIFCEEDRRFAEMAKGFRSARSHIPVRAVPALFAIDSHNDRIRALEHAQPVAHGRWFIILDPDVILEMLQPEESSEDALERWMKLLRLRAVRERRVYVLNDDFATIPGPRFPFLLKRVCRLLHPEASCPS